MISPDKIKTKTNEGERNIKIHQNRRLTPHQKLFPILAENQPLSWKLIQYVFEKDRMI
jgi:hypothetical protein